MQKKSHKSLFFNTLAEALREKVHFPDTLAAPSYTYATFTSEIPYFRRS